MLLKTKAHFARPSFFLFFSSGKSQTGFSLHHPVGSDVRYHNGDHPSHPTPSVGLSSLNAYGSHHHQPQPVMSPNPASGFQLHGDVAPTPPPRRAPSSVNASPQHRTTPTVHRCFFSFHHVGSFKPSIGAIVSLSCYSMGIS